MRWRSDPRLWAYLVSGFGTIVAAVFYGEPLLVGVGVPFVALCARGLREREPVMVDVGISVETTRVIEGDEFEGVIQLDWSGEAEVDVVLSGWRGVTPLDPEPHLSWSLADKTGPVELRFRCRARSWGDHPLGSVWVRARRPGALVAWEERLAEAPVLHVVPKPVPLGRLLEPSEPRRVSGVHLSKARGQGSDFAELRPYQPGDRLRDLAWATTARFGEPWVTVHHPERTGTVVLVLDTFFLGGERRPEAWARAARTAWAVASVHLRSQDRVGLIARGKTTVWLPPQGGRRARVMFLNELLAIGEVAEAPWRGKRRLGRVAVPPDAVVVGVTDLRSRAFLPRLIHYRRVGHAVGALVIDTADLQAEAYDRVGEAASRVWFAQRESERRRLHSVGIPTSLVTASEGLEAAVSALRRRMRSARPARRAGARGGGNPEEASA